LVGFIGPFRFCSRDLIELADEVVAELFQRSAHLRVHGLAHLPADILHEGDLPLLGFVGLLRAEVLQHLLAGLVLLHGLRDDSPDPVHGLGHARHKAGLDSLHQRN
jgi:hypothetical protein